MPVRAEPQLEPSNLSRRAAIGGGLAWLLQLQICSQHCQPQLGRLSPATGRRLTCQWTQELCIWTFVSRMISVVRTHSSRHSFTVNQP